MHRRRHAMKTKLKLAALALAIAGIAMGADRARAGKSEAIVINANEIKWGDAPPDLPRGAPDILLLPFFTKIPPSVLELVGRQGRGEIS